MIFNKQQSMRMLKRVKRAAGYLGLILISTFAGSGAWAQGLSGFPDNFDVPIHKSRVIKMHTPIKRVSMGNPGIADIVVLKHNQLYVLGKKLGTTNVLLWSAGDKLVKVLDVEVVHDLTQLKKKLYQLMPDEQVETYSSQGAIVLRGQVSDIVKMDRAVSIAESFAHAALTKTNGKSEKAAGPRVVNLMSVGGSQQVMLKVTVAELERRTMRKMGIKWFGNDLSGGKWRFGGVNGGGAFPDFINEDGLRELIGGNPPIVGPAIDEFFPNDLSITDKGLFSSFLTNDFVFSASLEAAKENGLAKVLAEPTLTALSGQEAAFLSGGEFPIPVPDNDDGVTIEFKEFGVGVRFLPVVLTNGTINLKLNVKVSELTSANSVAIGSGFTSSTFFIPSLSTRNASTTIELGDGQSIGIAGLLSENMRGVVNKFPGLGDIPILGHLFRSEEFERGETELVILVTPTLVQAMSQPISKLPTDSFIEPSDIEFYLMGKINGTPRRKKAGDHDPNNGTNTTDEVIDNQEQSQRAQLEVSPQTGGVDGQFGHSIN